MSVFTALNNTKKKQRKFNITPYGNNKLISRFSSPPAPENMARPKFFLFCYESLSWPKVVGANLSVIKLL